MQSSRRIMGVRCNLGAIFCGALITLALGATAVLIGNGLGLSPVNLIDPRVSRGAQVGSWIFHFLTWVLAFSAGGWFGARIGGIPIKRQGLFYGLASWALAGVFVTLFGLRESFTFTLLLTGEGPAAVNWVLIAVAILGALGSALGGALGATGSAGTAGKAQAAAGRESERQVA